MYNNNNSQSTAVQDKFDRFEAWLISNGARFDHVCDFWCDSMAGGCACFCLLQSGKAMLLQ